MNDKPRIKRTAEKKTKCILWNESMVLIIIQEIWKSFSASALWLVILGKRKRFVDIKRAEFFNPDNECLTFLIKKIINIFLAIEIIIIIINYHENVWLIIVFIEITVGEPWHNFKCKWYTYIKVHEIFKYPSSNS